MNAILTVAFIGMVVGFFLLFGISLWNLQKEFLHEFSQNRTA